ncbi:MAG TPA: redoxin domain-containing protein [Gammaproteobacteria bacterium]|nr:redoxin domain-containing protein [Gammaproteobacteria bacterium]
MSYFYRLQKKKIAALFFVSLFSLSISAIEPGDKVENFRLLDQKGGSHELFYYDDKKALVFLVQGNGCPFARNAAPRFQELRDIYSDKEVEFFMLNSNLQDDRLSISEEAKEYGYDLNILIDETQIIGESLELSRTGEVFIVNPKNWSVAYIGAIDDRLTYENQKKVASEHFLKDAIDDLLAGEFVAVPRTESLGCLINFPNKYNKKSISYSQQVAPILLENCAVCHRKGGVGPWAMTDYNMVKGFSLMMREVIRTKRMPPWHADPFIGQFSNDRSLNNEEIKTLVHWIEAGAPKGEGADPLLGTAISQSEWANEEELGPPDYVINIPATDIPATGVVDYQYKFVKNTVGKDVWVKAAEVLPGDKAVLHHVITSFGQLETRGPRKGRLKYRERKGLRGYAPGINSNPYPDGGGIFLPADVAFEFQMHYTPVGRATVDETRMGIWVAEEKPKHEIFSMMILNPRIRIPAGVKEHKESATRVVSKDALLYSVLVHAHYRGKKMVVAAYYPNGTTEVLLSVPNYDFNWQTSYDLEEPKFLPAGTTLIQHQWWDNSAQNLANPDPTVEVTWGDQSFEEMLFGAYLMRDLKEEELPAYKTLVTKN